MSESVPVTYLWLIPVLPLLGSVINGILALATSHREEGPPPPLVSLIACLAPIASFVLTVVGFLQLRGLPVEGRALTQELFSWISVGALHLPMGSSSRGSAR
jgi:NADH-quinone oxidoreductase subunit L